MMNAKYERLRKEAQTLLGTDVETRFRIAALLSAMTTYKTPAEVAQDVSMKPWEVRKFVKISEFWGDTRMRLRGKQTGRWTLYAEVACSTVLTDDQRADIKATASQGMDAVWLAFGRCLNANRQAHAREYSHKTNPVFDALIDARLAEVTEISITNLVRTLRESLHKSAQLFDQLESLSEDDYSDLHGDVMTLVDHMDRMAP